MKRKLALLLVAIMLVTAFAGILSACNDKSEGLNLMLYSPANNQAKVAYQKMLAKFTEETGIKVNPTFVPKDNYNTKLSTNFGTSKRPDVFFLDQPALADYADKCLDLTTGFYAEEGQDGLKLSDFYQVAIDTVTYKEKILAVPFSLTSSIILYNKKYVSKVPSNWNEWLNTSVPDGKALFGGIGSSGYASWYFQGFLKSVGGEMISNNQVVFNNAQGVKAGQMIKDLYAKSPKNIRESSNAFTNGNVLFVLAHNADVINYFTTNPTWCNENLGATLFIPENTGGTSYSNIGGENIAIYKDTADVEGAKKLVQFLLREENIDIAISNNYSAIKSYAKVRTSDPVTGESYSQALQDALGVILKQLETASARPVVKNWTKVNDLYLANALSDIISNGADVQTAFDTAQQQAQNVLQFD